MFEITGRDTNWSLDNPDGYQEPAQAKRHKLDSPEYVELHSRLMGHFFHEIQVQAPGRKEMEIDADFKDHIQYTEGDLAILEDRGQTPLVYNVAATTINWLIGTERRSRMDFAILPRSKEGGESAERKTELIKYIADVNHSAMHYSRAFAEQATVGLSWLECGVQADNGVMPVYERKESWRNIFCDSLHEELDASDARYIFRAKWADVDTAVRFWPKRRGTILSAVSSHYMVGADLSAFGEDAMDSWEESNQEPGYLYGSGTGVYQRQRVRLIECWFRTPVDTQIIRGGEFSGEVYDPDSPGHQDQVKREKANIVTSRRMRMNVALMTSSGLLSVNPSPYRHDQFPFTPLYAYRRSRDGVPYGVMRGLRDPQRDLNARAGKLLHILATKRVLVAKGSVDDLEELRLEAARPDSVIEYDATKPAPQVQTDLEQVTGHMQMMDVDIGMIQRVGGVTDENLGRTTNATSGKAIVAKQDQGALATAELFDNLRFARMIHGEKLMVCTEQYLTGQQEFRTRNERGGPDFHKINDGDPANNIALHKANYIISQDEWRASMRQANTERLLAVLQQLAPAAPHIVSMILDLVVEAMDIPKRDEIVKRIREGTGILDPDLDPDSPEAQAAQQAQAEQQALQQRAVVAEIEEKEARAQELQAKAAKTGADADVARAKVASEELANMNAALMAAEMLLRNAGLGPMADSLLSDARNGADAPAAGLPDPLPGDPPLIDPPPAQPEPQEPPQMQPTQEMMP